MREPVVPIEFVCARVKSVQKAKKHHDQPRLALDDLRTDCSIWSAMPQNRRPLPPAVPFS